MDRQQLRMLKKIRNSKIYEYTTDPDWKTEIIHYLARRNYIYYHCEDINSPNKYCIINQEGRAAIYDWYRERRRWFVPLAVSIFAAIGGYREELLRLIQAIGSLWKTITGG